MNQSKECVIYGESEKSKQNPLIAFRTSHKTRHYVLICSWETIELSRSRMCIRRTSYSENPSTFSYNICIRDIFRANCPGECKIEVTREWVSCRKGENSNFHVSSRQRDAVRALEMWKKRNGSKSLILFYTGDESETKKERTRFVLLFMRFFFSLYAFLTNRLWTLKRRDAVNEWSTIRFSTGTLKISRNLACGRSVRFKRG